MATKRKLYSFEDHPEHKAQLGGWAERWIANALNCVPMTPDDVTACTAAIHGLYDAAKLERPLRVVIAPSPFSAAIAAGVAAAVWYLRGHPDEQRALVGASLSEADYPPLIAAACTHAVHHGMCAVDLRVPSAPPAPTLKRVNRKRAAATGAATRAATRDATWAATEAATGAATGAATEAATEAATRAATGAATGSEAVRFILGCIAQANRMMNGGSEWSGWPAYLSFFRHISGLNLPEYVKWDPYEQAGRYGVRYMHPRFCIVSDRSQFLLRDDQNRPHSDTGPYRAWRDGWRLYFVHGVRVPAWVVMEPERITAKAILTERNAEVRRVMLERMGHERFLADAGATPFHQDRRGELFRIDLPGDEPVTLLRVVNSTPEPDGHAKLYTLRVPPTMKTATEAVAWTFGLEVAQYRPQAES